MPYIAQQDRARLKKGGEFAKTTGELNFLLTKEIVTEIVKVGRSKAGSDSNLADAELFNLGRSYALFNEIVADLDTIKMLLGQGVRLEDQSFLRRASDHALMFVLQTGDLDTPGKEPQTQEEFDALRREVSLRMAGALGAVECAKLEFMRRVVAPYEDGKILANGDVYP